MRLDEVTNKKTPICFVGVNLDERTEREILGYIKENDIPNPISQNKMHITVVFSKTPFEYKPLGDIQESAEPIKFDTFTNNKDGKTTNCLVLKLKSKFLRDQFKLVTEKYGAVSDFDTYHPHVTFSYDIGDMDFSKLPKYTKPIKITEEYFSKFDY